MRSARSMGTFERNIGWYFIYRTSPREYFCVEAQTQRLVCRFPPTFNPWQAPGQIKIWLLANGLIR